MRLLPIVVVLLVAGCASGGGDTLGSAEPDVSRVSFVPAPEAAMQALLTGTLGGDPSTGCLWVEGPHRVPLVIQHDTAVLDISAQPPVVRDGEEVLAALGDAVEVGGGHAGTSAPGCEDLGPAFLGHGLTRPLPGEPPRVTLRDVRRDCGPTDGPALRLTAVVEGGPRLPLTVEVQAHPAGTRLGLVELTPEQGERDVLVPFDDLFAALPDEVLVTVSEGPQALAQALADPRPGPACG